MASSTKSIQGRNAESSLISDAEIADVLDFRVMAAREVMAEDAWRVNGQKLKPADLAEIDRIAVETGTATTVREQVEEFCGESLADDAPHSWQVEDYEPVLRFADDPGTQETEAPWERPAGAVSPL